MLATIEAEMTAVEKEIAKREKEFKAATQAGKRVLIAKDVIRQIKDEKWNARRGAYVRFDGFVDTLFSTQRPKKHYIIDSEDQSLQTVLLGQEGKDICECCALGAMMLSCTLYNNKLSGSDVYEGYLSGAFREEIDEKLENKNGFNKFFSKSQLDMIEFAFEQGFEDANKMKRKEVVFGMKYKDDTERMLAIMRNIIKNNGTFKP